MPIRVREGNTWKLVANPTGISDTVTGSYEYYGPGETTEKVANTSYTNNTTKLIHVSATIGIDRNASIGSGTNAKTLIAGSYVLASITSPQNVTTEVANIRDNGSEKTQYLFLNPQFFVPVGYSYIIKLYDSDDNDWSQSTTYPNAVETFAWSEFKFELQ